MHRPNGVPESMQYRGKKYDFDCVAGTGEPIFQHVKESGERLHIIRVRVNRSG